MRAYQKLKWPQKLDKNFWGHFIWQQPRHPDKKYDGVSNFRILTHRPNKKLVIFKGCSVRLYLNYYFFLKSRNNSPNQSTKEVDPMMISQSVMRSGVTLKNSPPQETMKIWPSRITNAMSTNPPQFLKWKADLPVSKARALNIFQNWRNTKIVKNIESSLEVRLPAFFWREMKEKSCVIESTW